MDKILLDHSYSLTIYCCIKNVVVSVYYLCNNIAHSDQIMITDKMKKNIM